MDFYETSACTNLNIKEVRTLKPSCLLSLAKSGVGKPEGKVAARSQDKMRPCPLGITGLQEGEEERLD